MSKQISDRTIKILQEGLSEAIMLREKYKAMDVLSNDETVKVSCYIAIQQTIELILKLVGEDNVKTEGIK